MSRIEKQVNRLLSNPTDYTFSECSSLLTSLGYRIYNKGRTSGSRVRFFRESDQHVIDLHKPHPGDIMKPYAVKLVRDRLKEYGDI